MTTASTSNIVQARSLADLKRLLALPGVEVLVYRYEENGEVKKHRYSEVWRSVRRLQTTSVEFVDDNLRGSWCYFGKASEWSFLAYEIELRQDGQGLYARHYAIQESEGTVMGYCVREPIAKP